MNREMEDANVMRIRNFWGLILALSAVAAVANDCVVFSTVSGCLINKSSFEFWSGFSIVIEGTRGSCGRARGLRWVATREDSL